MIRTWPGQTKEEWLKEYHRDKLLTIDERLKERDEYIRSVNQKWKSEEKERELQKQKTSENPFANYDHPNSLENDEATILWIVVMAIATIFKGNWIIWIVATIIWRRYINRHKIKK